MGTFSNYLENAVLDHIFGGSAFSQPAIYVALSTTDPLDSGSGITEPVGNNYSRKLFADWTASSGGSVENNTAITFDTPSGSWGAITHFALFDASSGGNMLAHAALPGTKNIGTGDTPEFAAGDLVTTLD